MHFQSHLSNVHRGTWWFAYSMHYSMGMKHSEKTTTNTHEHKMHINSTVATKIKHIFLQPTHKKNDQARSVRAARPTLRDMGAGGILLSDAWLLQLSTLCVTTQRRLRSVEWKQLRSHRILTKKNNKEKQQNTTTSQWISEKELGEHRTQRTLNFGTFAFYTFAHETLDM